MSEQTKKEVDLMSTSTIDGLLRRWRGLERHHGFSTTKPGTLLKNAIPIKTFSEWTDSKPGFMEVDLVAHCGDNAGGFYLNTLSAVDVATGWYEPVVIWGKDRKG